MKLASDMLDRALDQFEAGEAARGDLRRRRLDLRPRPDRRVIRQSEPQARGRLADDADQRLAIPVPTP
jgi:hypothetical protein